MKKILILFSIFSFLFLFGASFVQASTSLNISFFYGDGCPHCAEVKPVITDLETRYPQVEFKSHEVYHDQTNALLLYQFYDQYNVPQSERGVPVVFVKGEYLVGDQSIIDNLENKIIAVGAHTENEIKPNLTARVVETFLPIGEQEPNKSYSLWAITGAAVVDSINPCAIAVLLILLTVLMTGAGDKWRALRGGLAFILSIYITYFLFGLGLLQLINIANLAGAIAKIVGVIAIIIGLANIKDFIFYGGGGFVMEIPRSWRPTLKKIINGITSPIGAFLAGFAVTFFELPCTGGPYFFVIGLLSQAQNLVDVLPVLLYYNLVFVLPLLVIVFVIHFGISSIQRAEDWKERNIRILHLISGVIMLALGFWIFLM